MTVAGRCGRVLEEVALTRCYGVGARLDGWRGPPWLKEGWFHA